MLTDPKSWKLYRCVYDEMGLRAVEGEWGFEDKDLDYDSFIVCSTFENCGHTCFRTEIEGSKENLEYVLGLINADE